MKYRKRPSMVDAFQLGVNLTPDWFMKAVDAGKIKLYQDIHDPKKTEAEIKAINCWLRAYSGDFIFLEETGEIRFSDPEVFLSMYEAVE